MKTEHQQQTRGREGGDLVQLLTDLGFDFFGELLPLWVWILVFTLFVIYSNVAWAIKLFGQD